MLGFVVRSMVRYYLHVHSLRAQPFKRGFQKFWIGAEQITGVENGDFGRWQRHRVDVFDACLSPDTALYWRNLHWGMSMSIYGVAAIYLSISTPPHPTLVETHILR